MPEPNYANADGPGAWWWLAAVIVAFGLLVLVNRC